MSPLRKTFSKAEIEASEWLVTLSDRTVSLQQRAEFETWLAADPENERVYQTQKSAWTAVAGMPHLLDEAGSASSSSPLSRFRQGFGVRVPALALAAGIVLAALAIWFFAIEPHGFFNAPGEFATATAQVKDVRLEDGSLVTLGASSHIEVEFAKEARRVILTRGEAFFEVTRDTSRPFFVTAGDTQVRVVGTKFDVHYGPKAVRVAVLEGRVSVVPVASSAFAMNLPTRSTSLSRDGRGTDGEVLLSAGEQVTVGDVAATASTINTEDLGAWRQGRLVYVDARLRDVVADINRYYDGKIELADDSVGNLQLTAAFRADQIDRMLEVLESALPIRSVREDDKRIVLSTR